MNNKKILEKFKMNVAIRNFKSENENKHTLKEKIKWKFCMKKKLIVGLCGCFILLSGVVLANYDKIIATFGLGAGIDLAVKNGYIANPNMNYIESDTIVNNERDSITLNDIKVNAKIKDFIMDDINISTHFSFKIDTKINETIDMDNLQNIELKDLIVTDEKNRILYCMDKETFETYCKENNLAYKFTEFNENYYNCGLNNILIYSDKNGFIEFTYNMYSGDNSFPKSKKINFKFTEIQLEGNNKADNKNCVISLKGEWNIKLDVPEQMYNRKNISYKVVSCDNPDFKVTNATLTNTGFEIGIIISNMKEPEQPLILKKMFNKLIRGEINNDEFNERINTEKELIEASEQDSKNKHPIVISDWDDNGNEILENITYVENEKCEKFTSTMSASRRQDSNYIEGDKFSFYETFGLTTYDATDKLKVRVMFKDNPYIIELERIYN